MRAAFFFAVVLGLFLVLDVAARDQSFCGPGGCGPGGCGPGGCLPAWQFPGQCPCPHDPLSCNCAGQCQCGPNQRGGFHWVYPSDPSDYGRVYLYRFGVQVGGWDQAEQYYRPYDAARDCWGPRHSEPPIPPPAPACPPKSPPARPSSTPRLIGATSSEPQGPPYEPRDSAEMEWWQTHGVDTEKLDHQERSPCYSIGGKCLAPRAVFSKLDDDSHKLWLVVIGSEKERSKFIEQFQHDPKLAPLAAKTRTWSVPADHWSLYDRDTQQPMFSTKSDPTIYLLEPDGSILYEQRGRDPGDLDNLRKADPSYKPDGPRPVPAPGPANTGPALPGSLLLIGCGTAAVFALSRRRHP